MLREAQLERARLIESRVRRIVRARTSTGTVPSAESSPFLSSFHAAAIDPP